MIGRINPPPCFSNGYIDRNNDAHPGKKPLINQITGSVINVKNTNADLRLVSKELSLYREVKNNAALATLADTKLHSSLNTRLSSLGMAVTAIYNMVEGGKAKEESVDICDKNPGNKSMELNSDPFLTKRGTEYINKLIDTETPLDSTNYAIGLRVGSDMKKLSGDRIMVDQFNATWNMRLDMAT